MIVGFEGSEAGEAVGVIAKLLVLLVRKQGPVIHWVGVLGKSSVPAALFVIAYAQEGGWILYRQRPEEHRVHEGEDGGGGSDAERESEDSGEGEARRSPQLPQCMFQVSQQRVLPPDAGVSPAGFPL
jgi:hypothetical protein